ncbi:MAG TPA: glycoside hydrolase family 15 protein [Chloroflexi bacterium]|jgi:glucoamylase|nr:glycoside hydrolase family 15 protein [Chloroflexota bacterium]
MPRDIPVGNGSLLVNFDESYYLRDIYWPHVGQENHTAGRLSRFGVWVDGQFSWTDDGRWDIRMDYAGYSLVTRVTLRHQDLALNLECEDVVDFEEDLYLRRLVVHNEADRDREVRLFLGHDLSILGYTVGDTAYYEPERRAVIHYKGRRWFLINTSRKTSDGPAIGVDQWATGRKAAHGREGTWRDAEDGMLSGHPIDHGSVDSCIAIHLDVPARDRAIGWYWLAVGESFGDVTRLNRLVRDQGPSYFLERTRGYWNVWATKEGDDFADLPDRVRRLYRRSLLILRTQIDNNGAIIAANDYDITHFGGDTYAYSWPRDGALVAAALVAADHSEATQRFFEFCERVQTQEGYLLHKYNPDGSLASSWHGWYEEGERRLPIQEDETALVVWALWRHFESFRDVEFIKPHYRHFVIPAANWMADYVDRHTGLPLPSWDLWEERYGVTAWTVGAVWGALDAAARFSEVFGERDLSARYRQTAKEIRAAALEHLWDEDLGRFLRLVRPRQGGAGWERDATIDASMVGLWMFGLLEPDDERVVATMQAIREHLWVQTSVGGIARFEDDTYHQISHDIEKVPGNPWVICTLWLAQWYIATARTSEDLDPALDLLNWTVQRALPSGVLPEQVHPHTGEHLSVSPLTWSHSTLVLTVRQYVEQAPVLGSHTGAGYERSDDC